MFCITFISSVLTFESVPLRKLTTNSAEPSVEIAKLRADFPVATVLIALFAAKSQAITLPEMFSVA
jgi:hypothetical protein